jgi:hypothetical protein
MIDEQALAAAIKEGRVAGAGIDVYAKEPCTDSPLFELDQVVVTPHLGASTDEAQEKAGISVARSVRQALGGELVPDAVNIQGGHHRRGRAPRPAARREASAGCSPHLAGGAAQQLDVVVAGEITQHDVKVLELSALKGVFADITEQPGLLRQRPATWPQERGIEVRLTTSVRVARLPQPGHRARHAGRAARSSRCPAPWPVQEPGAPDRRRQRLPAWTSAMDEHTRLLPLHRPARRGRHPRPDPRRRPA